MSIDLNDLIIQNTASVSSSGSVVFTGLANLVITLNVNIGAPPSGILNPSLTYYIQEVNSIDQDTGVSPAVNTHQLTSVGTTLLTLTSKNNGTIKVSWILGGLYSNFPNVNASLSTKPVVFGTSGNPLTTTTGAIIQPVNTGQLPSALIGNRLDTNIGSWLGSTAPTVGQKASANSIPIVIASDQSPLPVSVSSSVDRTSTGTITNTQSVSVNTQASGACGVQITGTWTGTLVFEATVNGTTWNSINATVPTTGIEVTSTTSNGAWTIACGGFEQVRVRGNTIGSGSVSVFLNSSSATQTVILGDPLPTGANVIGSVNQGTSPWVTISTSSAGTITSVAAIMSDTLLLASNAARKGAIFYNDTTTAQLRIALSTSAASTTNFTALIANGGLFELPYGYTGQIRGIFSATDGGFVRITEFT